MLYNKNTKFNQTVAILDPLILKKQHSLKRRYHSRNLTPSAAELSHKQQTRLPDSPGLCLQEEAFAKYPITARELTLDQLPDLIEGYFDRSLKSTLN